MRSNDGNVLTIVGLHFLCVSFWWFFLFMLVKARYDSIDEQNGCALLLLHFGIDMGYRINEIDRFLQLSLTKECM